MSTNPPASTSHNPSPALDRRNVYLSFEPPTGLAHATTLRRTGLIDAHTAHDQPPPLKRHQQPRRHNIDRALEATTVTIAVIGAASTSTELAYELDHSTRRGNGILALRFGPRPMTRNADPGEDHLASRQIPIYTYAHHRLNAWIERAAIAAGHPCLLHGVTDCIICR